MNSGLALSASKGDRLFFLTTCVSVVNMSSQQSRKNQEIKLPAITPATAAPAIAAEPRPFLLRPGLIDGEVAPVKLSSVQSLDRFLSLCTGTHLDEAKTLGSTGKFIGNHPG